MSRSLSPTTIHDADHSLDSPCTPLEMASRRDAKRTRQVLVMAMMTEELGWTEGLFGRGGKWGEWGECGGGGQRVKRRKERDDPERVVACLSRTALKCVDDLKTWPCPTDPGFERIRKTKVAEIECYVEI